MKYLAYDGKVFDNQEQCTEYENSLNQQAGERERDYHDLMVLRDDYMSAKKKYEAAMEAYYEKYESTVEDLLRRLFPII